MVEGLSMIKKLGHAAALGLLLVGCAPDEVEQPSTPEPAQETELLPATMVQAGQGEAIRFPLHATTSLAGADTNSAKMSFFELVIDAKSAGAPPHTHTHEDEFFYVREGQITFMAEGERQSLSAGGFVMLPRGSLHAFWNDGESEAILLCGTSDGKFGDFFDAVAVAAREANARTPADLGPILGAIAAERGIFIDMSKVPADVAALYGLPPVMKSP